MNHSRKYFSVSRQQLYQIDFVERTGKLQMKYNIKKKQLIQFNKWNTSVNEFHEEYQNTKDKQRI